MPAIIRCRLRQKTINHRALGSIAQIILVKAGVPDVELSLELVGKQKIRTLNRAYRHQDRPTDVLAFPLWEGPGPCNSLLGDVVISIPMAESQASELGHTLDAEMVQLLIHGILHLVGYDHERGERDARRMRQKERSIFKALQPIPRLVRNKKKP